MQVALDGANRHGSQRLNVLRHQQGLQNFRARLHRACRDENLGNVHFAVFKLLAQIRHADDQTFVQDRLRLHAFRQRFAHQLVYDLSSAAFNRVGNLCHISHAFFLLVDEHI